MTARSFSSRSASSRPGSASDSAPDPVPNSVADAAADASAEASTGPVSGTACESALCPQCSSASVRIHAHVAVTVLIAKGDGAADVRVLDERIDAAEWDGSDRASCPLCDWQGCVGDLLHEP